MTPGQGQSQKEGADHRSSSQEPWSESESSRDPGAATKIAEAHDDPQVTAAKIARTGTVITALIGLTGVIITAFVAGSLGYQHGVQDAAQDPGISNVTPAQPTSSQPVPSQPPPPFQSLTKMTAISGSRDPVYQFGPQTVNTKPYYLTMYLTGGPCLYSVATYQLGYKYKRFHAAVGLNDESVVHGVIFTVQVDQRSPSVVTVAPGQGPHSIDVDLTGAYRITLRVEGDNECALGGDRATAVWIDPFLTS